MPEIGLSNIGPANQRANAVPNMLANREHIRRDQQENCKDGPREQRDKEN